MARAIFPHELSDPDFSWLITSFRENNPGYTLLESTVLPIVMIPEEPNATRNEAGLPAVVLQPAESDDKLCDDQEA